MSQPIARLSLLFLLAAGCAQNASSPIDQSPGFSQTSPAANDQETATQGSQVYVQVINAPGGGPGGFGIDPVGEEALLPPLFTDLSNQDGTSLASSHAGYAQAGININVNTGSTTPSVSGTTTASASGTQAAGATPTVSPVQDIRPEISASVNAAFAPGGLIDQLAAAVGRGSLSDLDKSSQQELRSAALEALQTGDMHPLLEALAGVFGGGATLPALPPAPIVPPPATQPAGS